MAGLGLLERMVAGRGQVMATNPFDERYWSGETNRSLAGINVTPETVLGFNAAFDCIRIIAEDTSTLPIDVLRKRPSGRGRDEVPGHPLDYLLNVRANELQIALEWREWTTRICTLHAEAVSEIHAGRAGFVEELAPLHPPWLKKESLPNGRVRYEVKEPQKPVRHLSLDEVFRIPSPLGQGLVKLMKEDIGAGLAGRRAMAALWKNGMRHQMGVSHPGKLSDAAQKNLKESLHENAGAENWGKFVVFEEGMTFKELGVTPEDAESLKWAEFTILDMARWFRVRPHKVAYMLQAGYSSVEQANLEHVTDTIRPWCVRWERAAAAQLFLDPLMYIKHNLDAILRGDALSRAQVMEIQKRIGMRNANELRELDDLNPRTDPGGEVYWDKQPGTGSSNEPGSVQSRARSLAEAAATRVLNREKLALEQRAKQHGADFEAWKASITEFYQRHAEMVTDNLQIDADLAAHYCHEKAEELLRDGPAATERWDARDLPALIMMALREETE
jgi:HK97 family phage portal protein